MTAHNPTAGVGIVEAEMETEFSPSTGKLMNVRIYYAIGREKEGFFFPPPGENQAASAVV